MKSLIDWFLSRRNTTESTTVSVGLLFLRVAVGFMMAFGHGWGKLTGFGANAAQFSDPYGLSSTVSMGLAIFAEFFCSIALALGLFTRAVVIPLIVTMLTAVLIVHADDPWGRKEMALMYLIPFVTILIAGPGKYSLDQIFRHKH